MALQAMVTEGLGATAISKQKGWPLSSVKKRLRWLRANPGVIPPEAGIRRTVCTPTMIANANDWIQGQEGGKVSVNRLKLAMRVSRSTARRLLKEHALESRIRLLLGGKWKSLRPRADLRI